MPCTLSRPKATTPLRQKLAFYLATVFGAGCFSSAPGTVGTLTLLPFTFWICQRSPLDYTLFVLLIILVGFWSIKELQPLFNEANDDPSSVVIDEVAGFALTLWAIPANPYYILAGFLLFRILDIWKPGPIGWLDRKLRGPLAIMVDDLAAGLIAGLLLYGFRFIVMN
ncbi:phosphatidylglycerophosphatase A family protein [Magnetococcales bacterium HHB-1]